MDLTARDVMIRDVLVVSPQLTLPELERRFLHDEVTGFPVLEDDQLVGIISRSDVVRHLCVERSLVEFTSSYYQNELTSETEPDELVENTAARLGRRIESVCVGDVMSRKLITVSADAPIAEVARALVEKKIHRMLVIEDGRLVGIISSLDLVRLIADGLPKSG